VEALFSGVLMRCRRWSGGIDWRLYKSHS